MHGWPSWLQGSEVCEWPSHLSCKAALPSTAAGAGTPGLPRLLSCRATLTPFIANNSMGLDTFKWLLFGDDGEQAAHSKEDSAQL